MTRRRQSLVLLALASGTSPFGMTIILPALPTISEQFDADYALVQLVVSGYLLGVALAQPISGFLCDRFGRRPVIIVGFGIFVLASIGCALATSLTQLVAFRVLQAIGASAGPVASRAIVRDTYSAEMGARALSWITVGLGVAPILGPMVGGWLLSVANLRAVFLLSASIGAILLVAVTANLRESRGAAERAPRLDEMLGNYGRLLRSRPFLGHTLLFGFIQGSFFAFLAVGAAVFEESFGVGPTVFGVVWGGMAIAYVLGAMLGGRLSVSTLSASVLPTGVFLTFAGGLVMLLLVVTLGVTPATVLLPLSVLMLITGALTPLVMNGAVEHHPDIAGTSAGLSNALGLVIGNLFVITSGILYAGSFLPIAILIAVSTTLTAASYFVLHGTDAPTR